MRSNANRAGERSPSTASSLRRAARRVARAFAFERFEPALGRAAQVVCAAGVLALVATGAADADTPWTFVVARAAMLLLCAGLGSVLLERGGLRAPQTAALGRFLLAIACAYSRRPLDQLWAMSSGPLQAAAGLLLCVPFDYVAPYFLWRFAELFPRPLYWGGLAAYLRGGRILAGVVAVATVALGSTAGIAALLGATLPWSGLVPSGPQAPVPWLALGLGCALALAALPALGLRARDTSGDHGARARLFLGALGTGLAPIFFDLLFASLFSSSREASMQPLASQAIRQHLVLASLLLIPLGTAYSVSAHRILPLRWWTMRGLQYLLGRTVLLTLVVVPLLGAGWFLSAHRDRTLGELAESRALWILGGLAAASWLLLRMQATLLGRLDRAFFRERADARFLLELVAEHARQARDPQELAQILGRGIERALHVEAASLYLRLGDGNLRADSLTLPAGILHRTLGESGGPLLVLPELLTELTTAERQWVVEAHADLIMPILRADGALVGALAIGAKRSDLDFMPEDLHLLETVAHATALALEVLELRAHSTAREGEQVAHVCAACDQVQPLPVAGRCQLCQHPEVEAAAVPLSLGGRYDFLERIGQGSLGVVFRVRDPWLGRDVAAKTLARLSSSRAAELRREARLLAGLDHPHVAAVYGLEVWRETPILLLEYFSAGTLADRLELAAEPPERVARMGIALADGLAYLHARGILHRDIKPANVGITAEGTPKLLDLSLARWDRPLASGGGGEDAGHSGLVGTLPYLSPETTRGEPPSQRVDLWALAVVLWEALAGRQLFTGRLVEDLVDAIQEAAVPLPPDLPAAWVTFFRRALAPDPAARPATARQLLELIPSPQPGR